MSTISQDLLVTEAKTTKAIKVLRYCLGPKTARHTLKSQHQVPKGTACEYGTAHPKQSLPGQPCAVSILPRYPYLGSQTLPAQQRVGLHFRPVRHKSAGSPVGIMPQLSCSLRASIRRPLAPGFVSRWDLANLANLAPICEGV